MFFYTKAGILGTQGLFLTRCRQTYEKALAFPSQYHRTQAELQEYDQVATDI